MLRHALIFLHLAGVVVWVGGMFFAYFCLRPAAVKVLEPPQRLPLWVAAFEPFLRFAAVAVASIVLSGFAMLWQTGFANAPLGWIVMAALGLLMAGLFGSVYYGLHPQLRRHCDASEWPAAAAVLNRIRQRVGANLVLSVVVVAAAVVSR